MKFNSLDLHGPIPMFLSKVTVVDHHWVAHNYNRDLVQKQTF